MSEVIKERTSYLSSFKTPNQFFGGKKSVLPPFKFSKNTALDIAAIFTVISIAGGLGHIASEKDRIEHETDQKFPDLTTAIIEEAQDYIRKNDKPEYFYDENSTFAQYKPLPPDIKEKIAYYIDLTSKAREKKRFLSAKQDETLPSLLTLGSYMTLAMGFVITRTDRLFKKII